MKIQKKLFPIFFTTVVLFTGCKPKDADIKVSVEEKLKTNTELTAPATVSVNDGVATIGGECKDNACVAKCEELAKSVKGVKSVVNNVTVAMPAVTAAPVEISEDTALSKGVTDALKDHPGVKASVNDGVVTLTGELKRSELSKLMMALHTLKPKKIENQLTLK